MKKCPKCGEVKEDSCFYIQKSGRHAGKLTSWCKQCCSRQSSEYSRNNKKKVLEEHKKWVNKNKDKVAFAKAKSAYGITEQEYKNLKRISQICGSKDKLVIDHSHKTGKIRGMLCQSCNKGLGFFKDNPALLERASDYVLGIHKEIEPDIFEKTYEAVEE